MRDFRGNNCLDLDCDGGYICVRVMILFRIEYIYIDECRKFNKIS